MKHAVLGTGDVGRRIATKLASLDHQVTLGSRTADNPKAAAWAAQTGGAHGTFQDAAAHADVVWNCVAGQHCLAALQQAGAANLSGKLLIDLSNPLDFSQGFPPSLSISGRDSLAETIQRAFPDARVVKTLNTMANPIMVEPGLLPEPTAVFLSGDDADAKAQVRQILYSFGWDDPIDLGDLSTARGVESWLPLWVRLYGALGTGEFNLKLVRA